MKNFIEWIRKAFEDEKGEASHKRIFVFVLMFLIVYMVVSGFIDSQIRLYAFYSVLITESVAVAIITVQNILQFFGRDRSVITGSGIDATITTPPEAKDILKKKLL